MIRPKREDFNNGKHIIDWLYWEQKYTESLNKYIDNLEKQLLTHSVVVPKGTLVCDCGSTDLKDYNDGLSKTCNNCGTALIAN